MDEQSEFYFENHVDNSFKLLDEKMTKYQPCFEAEWLPIAWKVRNRKLKPMKKLNLYKDAPEIIRLRMEIVASFCHKFSFKFRFYPLMVIIQTKYEEWIFDYSKPIIRLKHANRCQRGYHNQKKFTKVIFALFYILNHGMFTYSNTGTEVDRQLDILLNADLGKYNRTSSDCVAEQRYG
ncbi:hypothetical protein [Sporomusa acidovorans]|uniref:PiggyBac transposable element-derived protein domain-containing protein n=1 Tax=Sporomusa acidovorans (strain ATCC 49682 / DSM 3132 / Mol) TaxID=1123286 RepID=A0ABZ3JBP6_SPOA4|nr:hypothetical protein [Sporomusa acidovorans]OZC16996.1 hypothetical protein SPACI_39670 [Sporomusa acidovorans DSM 3132]SDF33619.1 hypothetical protein SAMN04488499_104424 [Sporomusa acidovorans]